ncbi:MAG: NAD-dependent epimerase/dehydratase family protein [Janthinobacterium lividum]
MHITILGGNGFLGRKIAARLAAEGALGGTPIRSLTLFDLAAAPVPPAAFPVRSLAGDLAELPAEAVPPGTSVVFHLAAVVSSAAEADYDLGRRVNLRGTDAVVDACRRLAASGPAPRVVFTSSVASFSGGQGAVVADDARQMPGNSYGAQKAAAELILADASRRGFLDAVSLRLPTVVIRPGRPNAAASSFVSAILREPLLDLRATLPVPDDFAVWICSPRRAMDWLLHAAVMDTSRLGADRGINPPGLSATTGEMLAALDRVRPGASALVDRRPDPAVAAIVGAWPAAFAASRSPSLGFTRHEALPELVQAFLDDDLEATRAERMAATA